MPEREETRLDRNVLRGMTRAETRAFMDRYHSRGRRAEEQATLEDWLSPLPWEWFVTITFKRRADGDAHRLLFCKRHAGRLFDEASRRLYGARWRRRRKGIYGIVVWERHKSGEWHAHALWAGTKGRKPFLKGIHAFCAKDAVLGHLWVKAPDSESGIKYVAKYVSKGPGVWAPIGTWRFDDPGVTPELVRALQSECEKKRA